MAKIKDLGEFFFLKREDFRKQGLRRTYLNKGGPGEVLCNKRRTCEFFSFKKEDLGVFFFSVEEGKKEYELKTNHEI